MQAGYAIRNALLMAVICSAAACTQRLPATSYNRPESYAITDGQTTPLGKALTVGIRQHKGQSGFQLLEGGNGAFVARIAAVQAASRSIDLQYFSTEDDRTGKLLLQVILDAADRGVRVRMLLDDWNLDDFRTGMSALDTHPNIEIRVFNPYNTRDQGILSFVGNAFTRFDQLTRRMHNKALIVDNEVTVMGGRNLGDEYFDASSDTNFRDMDVLAAGSITTDISKNFDRYWNSNEAYPVQALYVSDTDGPEIAALRKKLKEHWQQVLASPQGSKLTQLSMVDKLKTGEIKLVWAKAELAADSPHKAEQTSDETISRPGIKIDRLGDATQQEFIIVTPYFVPKDEGTAWLTSMAQRGVHVRILTNSLASTDMVPAEAGYSHYREALVQGGVELYEVKSELAHPPLHTMFKASSQNGLHAKLFVMDRKDLVVGSFNFDQRSINLNTEQVLVIHSPELAGQVAQIFEQSIQPDNSYHVMMQDGSLAWVTQEKGQGKTYSSDPGAGFWRNVNKDFFAILPIDDQL